MRRVKKLRQKRMLASPTFRLVFCEFTHDCGWEKAGEFCRGWQINSCCFCLEFLLPSLKRYIHFIS